MYYHFLFVFSSTISACQCILSEEWLFQKLFKLLSGEAEKVKGRLLFEWLIETVMVLRVCLLVGALSPVNHQGLLMVATPSVEWKHTDYTWYIAE